VRHVSAAQVGSLNCLMDRSVGNDHTAGSIVRKIPRVVLDSFMLLAWPWGLGLEVIGTRARGIVAQKKDVEAVVGSVLPAALLILYVLFECPLQILLHSVGRRTFATGGSDCLRTQLP